jgi:hypothetical protein
MTLLLVPLLFLGAAPAGAAPSAEAPLTPDDCALAGEREGRVGAYSERVRACGPAELASLVDALATLEPPSRRIACSRAGDTARAFLGGRTRGRELGTRQADDLCRAAQADLQGALAGLQRQVNERREAARAIDALPLVAIPGATGGTGAARGR